MGFNFLESIAYMTNLYVIFSRDGLGWYAAGFQWYGRQVLGLFFGHATYTAFIGAGLGIARQLPKKRQKAFAIVSGFLVAIAGHFSWDAWVQFFPIDNTLFGLVEMHLRTLIMTGPFTAAVIALLIFGIRYEAMGLVDQFKKEAATGAGAILPEDVPILASPWRRLRQRLRAFRRGGLRASLEGARLHTRHLDPPMARCQRQRHEIQPPLQPHARPQPRPTH